MMIMNFNAEAAKAAVKNCEAMRQAASMRIESEKLCSAVCDILESNGFAIEHSGNDKMIIVRW